jgi:hypothetical protein
MVGEEELKVNVQGNTRSFPTFCCHWVKESDRERQGRREEILLVLLFIASLLAAEMMMSSIVGCGAVTRPVLLSVKRIIQHP